MEIGDFPLSSYSMTSIGGIYLDSFPEATPPVNPKIKTKKFAKYSLLSLLFLLFFLLLWKEHAEQFIRWTPSYPQEELPSFSTVSQLSPQEIQFIYEQTGLSEVGLQRLEEANRLDELEVFHRGYFLEAVELGEDELANLSSPLPVLPVSCDMNSPISWEESVLNLDGNRGSYLPMVPLEKGDILLTPSSHCFGWRQGHAAMVVDTEEELTLESVVLGMNSKTQWLGKWQGFPAVIILRAKDPVLGEQAVELAMTYLLDVPYILTIGVFSEKFLDKQSVTGTNCSHLVWQAYQWAGVDIDSNGGIQVLPQDMAHSPYLEVVQIWGVNPEKMWN